MTLLLYRFCIQLSLLEVHLYEGTFVLNIKIHLMGSLRSLAVPTVTLTGHCFWSIFIVRLMRVPAFQRIQNFDVFLDNCPQVSEPRYTISRPGNLFNIAVFPERADATKATKVVTINGIPPFDGQT